MVLGGVAGGGAVWLGVAAGLSWWLGYTGGLVATALAVTVEEPWLVAGVAGGVFVALAVVIVWRWRVGRDERVKRGYRTIPGLASRRDVAAVGGQKAVLKAGATLRPSLPSPAIEDVAGVVGAHEGRPVWASVRETHLVVGPPGSGKGLHVVINGILDAPGAVITTSTRPDNLAVTYQARSRVGPVFVFDPEQVAPGVPGGAKWSPMRGCEDPTTATTRAVSIIASGFKATGENQVFADMPKPVLAALLHAAALDRISVAQLYEWSTSPARAGDALDILASHPSAAPGWAAALQAVIDMDSRERENRWGGMRTAMSALAIPQVIEAVSPMPGEEFDPEAFLEAGGTLYMIGTAQGAVTSAPLITALAEDIVQTAKRRAARSPNARMDPPLTLELDEAANYPLPSLPELMSEGGGSGIRTRAVFQSMGQIRHALGADQAEAVWDSATVKTILGGSANSDTLRDISALMGERDEITHTSNSDRRLSLLPSSTGESVRKVPVMSPDEVRELPFGMALLILRAAPPAVVDLTRWPDRPEGGQLAAERTQMEKRVRAAHQARELG
ncbi:TraM recognition domain-containing protein [Ruania zhangjianzhongii]|uniref:TraM recognition domain-containing protein n=1 Tax=Ruania zhangjianzhongii TaxID=2603206 RepID=UPI0011D1C31E|nr:TraM recognition domain-containing protein [Ruania zhangjianzhongii]